MSMDARLNLIAIALATCFCNVAYAQGPLLASRPMAPQTLSQARSNNFVVTAPTPAYAQEVAQAAEAYRRDLAIHWLGHELPNWPQPCPILVQPATGAGGETTFTLLPGTGTVGGWRMRVQGSHERVLDSVLPHEVSHTVFATHFAPFGHPLPRWADEGACTTVEHIEERSKHDRMLVVHLSSGRGIPFATMFSLKDYPADTMPLYSQGYSVTSFLIAQGGPRRFVEFLEMGMKNNDWVRATEQVYGYPMIGKLQSAWNKWVGDGGGEVAAYTASSLGLSSRALAQVDRSNNNPNAIRMASAQGSSVPVRSTVMASDPPSLGLASASKTISESGGGWYQRQLNSNQNEPVIGNQPQTLAKSDGTNLAMGASIPIGTATPNLKTASELRSNTELKAAPTDELHSVSHPQPVQTIGGPVQYWSPGPTTRFYR